MGSDFPRLVAWRNAIESGKAVGPHIVTSGPPVAEFSAFDEKLPVLLAHNAAEARQAFDQLWDLDVDFLTVLPQLSHDAYLAFAEQARHWGLRLVGPVPSSVTVWEAIDARHKSLEHMAGIPKAVATDREAIDFFERCALRDVSLAPILVSWRRMAHVDDTKLKNDARLRYVPEAIRKTWPDVISENPEATEEQVDAIYHLVSLTTRTGVEVLAGSGTGDPYTIPGATLHDELEQLVAAGLEPHQALRAATLAPARFLGWDEAMGTIEKGKVADLVLLNANPLLDIEEHAEDRGRGFSRQVAIRKEISMLSSLV